MSGVGASTSTTVDSRLVPVKQYTTPTTGSTVTVNGNGRVILFLNPAGTLATLTVSFPSIVSDQDSVVITTSQAITALTLNNATIIGALTSMAAGDCAEYTYFSDNLTWARTA